MLNGVRTKRWAYYYNRYATKYGYATYGAEYGYGYGYGSSALQGPRRSSLRPSPLTLRCEQTTPNNPSHVKEVSTFEWLCAFH